ncbi:U4/U6 small nuclear ribonucleoprotein [Penicillium verhagenii]|uniref:U4/U6 small nuclear ribonucleoprotein n=1 Tax=Penicillium verhagenii TaxID=1562060 RepID=UPI0025453FD3|nr:U4/U6 small nuclear ribonucleoprotein [Penicillium verhagenii]KAJ5917349.1 U4/U6 small nuclear ribonucleoprotein [Penicillium verhagenii]
MADASGNALKRPHPEDEGDNSQKRTRSNNGSPVPGSAGAPKRDIEKMIAEARAKAEAVRARLQAARGGATPPVPPAESSPSPAPPASTPALSRLEQMKARVAAATAKANAPPQRPEPPAHSYQQPQAFDDDSFSKARGGLDVGLHPALLSDATPDFRGSKGRQQSKGDRAGNRGKQLDLSGPSLEEIRNNPYFDPSLGPKATLAKPRQARELAFNQKGKYIQQAAALRRAEQLEAMKKRIAERARLAGIDEDMDVEKAYVVPAPPALEWWDEKFIDGSDYATIDDPATLKIDTVITHYIQHPIQLEPPQEKHVPTQKAMFLTPKEQAKIRRQRRMADLKEQQAKIRLGLEPAPPPKVKKSNLMRVLGEQAVKDPTAVEAQVNREIAERKAQHELMNEERKLTPDQRREKLEAQQEKDSALGIFMSVYRIDSLASGRNRFKIGKNAEQNKLTGICIVHPRLNLVIVEGGKHSVNNYRKLMLNRVDWTENPGPTTSDRNRESEPLWLSTEDDKGESRDFSQNTCNLIWEGQSKSRLFKRWVGARVCDTDSEAKAALARTNTENFWTLAKSFKPAEY